MTTQTAKAWKQLVDDAARYRFIRDALATTDGEFFIGVDSAKHSGNWALSGADADKAIDAAMQPATGGQT